MSLSPLTRRKIQRFMGIRRSLVSLIILGALVLLACGAELLVNSRALVVNYEGKLYFPTYTKVLLGTEFGLGYQYETNYRDLKKELEKSGKGWVILPPVPFNPYEQEFKKGEYPPYAPSFEEGHLLGTDRLGRDLLARILYGFRIAIFFALAFVGITFFIGVVLGCLMGYWGGAFDLFFQRIIEIWEQIPFLYVVMIIASIFKPDFVLFLGIFLLFGWSAKTWTVRALTYREREKDYVKAARVMGASTWRIIRVHLIPSVMVVVLTTLPFAVSGAISSLTALDYLGFGLAPPTPSWGELLSQGISEFSRAPWILTSILTAMTAILTMIAFVGEGLREAFDPKKFTTYK